MSKVSFALGWLRIGLHWLVAILIFVAWASIELSESFAKGSDQRLLMQHIHHGAGMTVWMLVWPRLLVSVAGHSSHSVADDRDWTKLAARLVHWMLYAFMLAMPLLGWLTLNAKGHALELWGWALPTLLEPNRSVAHWLKEMHEAGAGLGFGLMGLHAAAALFHHYVLRDNTLLRMLLVQPKQS